MTHTDFRVCVYIYLSLFHITAREKFTQEDKLALKEVLHKKKTNFMGPACRGRMRKLLKL